MNEFQDSKAHPPTQIRASVVGGVRGHTPPTPSARGWRGVRMRRKELLHTRNCKDVNRFSVQKKL